MDIFLSWSGERSRDVAAGLRNWLRSWDKQLKPWMSQRDIQAGQRWTDVLSRNLARSDFGVLCLTPENVDKPWLLFEAGAVSKAVNKRARVIPYLLFDLAAEHLPPPFRQFQSVKADFEGTLRLVQALSSKRRSDKLLKTSFENEWPELEAVLGRAATVPGQPWASRFELKVPPEYNNDLDKAEEALLVGVSLEKTLSTYKKRLMTKRDLRVLVASPDRSVIEAPVARKAPGNSFATAIASKRASIENSVAVFREIRDSVARHCADGQECCARLKTTHYPLAYGAHAMNPGTPSGVIYLKFYPYQVQNVQKPWMVIRANRDQEYKWFLEELECLWRDGQEVVD